VVASAILLLAAFVAPSCTNIMQRCPWSCVIRTGVYVNCGEEGSDGVGVHDDRVGKCTLGQEMGYHGSSKLKPMLVQFCLEVLVGDSHTLGSLYTQPTFLLLVL
jgi:hypothetical protein